MWLNQAKWIFVLEIVYLLVTIVSCLIIIRDTSSTSKTLAYLLFVVFVPFIGIFFYFSFGINYRKRKIYSKKLNLDSDLSHQVNRARAAILHTRKMLLNPENPILWKFKKLIQLLSDGSIDSSNLFPDSSVKLLTNGEQFFPLLLEKLNEAKDHIHIQFYIYENDQIGTQIKDILIKKAREGVEVRFVYDDFGSQSIRRQFVQELRDAGVQAYPFYTIKVLFFANRMNYRNHRKIVVIDGNTSFTGGINVSDKYINNGSYPLYWRDTNVMIQGNASFGLQRIFLSDWNFCSEENLTVSPRYFPENTMNDPGESIVQIISNGPDSDVPTILYSLIQAIGLAEKEVLLTTPYYIPDDILQEVLILSARSGIEIKLLVPKDGDSKLVNLAAQSYFEDLLQAGVRIFLYEKGFVHAKTFVIDRSLSSVGTANLDLRSFDLNFEVNALIYDEALAGELALAFDNDLKDSQEIYFTNWKNRGRMQRMKERVLRLVSPLL